MPRVTGTNPTSANLSLRAQKRNGPLYVMGPNAAYTFDIPDGEWTEIKDQMDGYGLSYTVSHPPGLYDPASVVPAYGELYTNDDSTTITVTTAGNYYKWSSSNVGLSAGPVTPSAATDTFTIGAGGAGIYKVSATACVSGPNGANIEMAVFKNNNLQPNLHVDQHIPASGAHEGMTTSGLLSLSPTDVLDLRFSSDTNGDVLSPDEVNFTIIRIA